MRRPRTMLLLLLLLGTVAAMNNTNGTNSMPTTAPTIDLFAWNTTGPTMGPTPQPTPFKYQAYVAPGLPVDFVVPLAGIGGVLVLLGVICGASQYAWAQELPSWQAKFRFLNTSLLLRALQTALLGGCAGLWGSLSFGGVSTPIQLLSIGELQASVTVLSIALVYSATCFGGLLLLRFKPKITLWLSLRPLHYHTLFRPYRVVMDGWLTLLLVFTAVTAFNLSSCRLTYTSNYDAHTLLVLDPTTLDAWHAKQDHLPLKRCYLRSDDAMDDFLLVSAGLLLMAAAMSALSCKRLTAVYLERLREDVEGKEGINEDMDYAEYVEAVRPRIEAKGIALGLAPDLSDSDYDDSDEERVVLQTRYETAQKLQHRNSASYIRNFTLRFALATLCSLLVGGLYGTVARGAGDSRVIKFYTWTDELSAVANLWTYADLQAVRFLASVSCLGMIYYLVSAAVLYALPFMQRWPSADSEHLDLTIHSIFFGGDMLAALVVSIAIICATNACSGRPVMTTTTTLESECVNPFTSGYQALAVLIIILMWMNLVFCLQRYTWLHMSIPEQKEAEAGGDEEDNTEERRRTLTIIDPRDAGCFLHCGKRVCLLVADLKILLTLRVLQLVLSIASFVLMIVQEKMETIRTIQTTPRILLSYGAFERLEQQLVAGVAVATMLYSSLCLTILFLAHQRSVSVVVFKRIQSVSFAMDLTLACAGLCGAVGGLLECTRAVPVLLQMQPSDDGMPIRAEYIPDAVACGQAPSMLAALGLATAYSVLLLWTCILSGVTAYKSVCCPGKGAGGKDPYVFPRQLPMDILRVRAVRYKSNLEPAEGDVRAFSASPMASRLGTPSPQGTPMGSTSPTGSTLAPPGAGGHAGSRASVGPNKSPRGNRHKAKKKRKPKKDPDEYEGGDEDDMAGMPPPPPPALPSAPTPRTARELHRRARFTR